MRRSNFGFQRQAPCHDYTQQQQGTEWVHLGVGGTGLSSVTVRGYKRRLQYAALQNCWCTIRNAAVVRPGHGNGATTAGSGNLPAEWEERYPQEGRSYYLDHSTRTTLGWIGPLPSGWEMRQPVCISLTTTPIQRVNDVG